jgi:NAD(P)-dependent dehydrogenase (short-subunit alcohol dehydrogenase family)
MRRPDLRSLTGRRVLVTGAASGIGRATALAAAAEGAVLSLTDRDDDRLRQVALEAADRGATVAHAVAADVSDYGQVRAFADQVHADTDALDVVLNVAGISTWGSVDRLSHEQWQRQVDVNLMGPIHVIESFVPPMMAAGRGGHLVNVSSAAGLIGLPWHAAYSAAKFGLRGVSEVLRFDLRPYGIGVSLVCPGAVATPLTDTVEIAGIDKDHPAVQQLHRRFVRHAVSPERAATAILDGVRRDRYLVYTSREIRAAHLLQRFAPPAYALVMQRINGLATRAAAPAVLS